MNTGTAIFIIKFMSQMVSYDCRIANNRRNTTYLSGVMRYHQNAASIVPGPPGGPMF
jgi:hypothetical protein